MCVYVIIKCHTVHIISQMKRRAVMKKEVYNIISHYNPLGIFRRDEDLEYIPFFRV